MKPEGVDRIAEWRELAQQDPAATAREVGRRTLTRLTPGQRRAVWAEQASEPELTRAIAQATSGPARAAALAGVPFAVKDLFDVAGWPTRAGARFLTEERPLPERDAALVTALRAAGAVPVGKTHLHEFAYGITGENPHYGDCEHPAWPGRTTGGSSSGSAAAVAAGLVPLALGTDTGGSVRVPAAFCGLFGLRLTPGHAWIRDAFPLAPSCDTPGWFTRTAEDLRAVNAALLGAPRRAQRTPRGCYLECGRLEADVAEACQRAARRWAEPADPETAARLRDTFEKTADAYIALTGPEAAAVHAAWLDRRRRDYSEVVWQRLDRGRQRTEAEQLRAAVRRQYVRDTLAVFFLTYDFLILPAVPCPAPAKAECNQETRERVLELTAPASLAGLPVLTLPVALPSGLTAGLQVLVPAAPSPVWDWMLAP